MKLGDWFGVPIVVHSSTVVLVLGFGLYGAKMGGLTGAAVALLGATLLLGCVVLHELGHALAAQRFGISTVHITIYPFGGVAAIQRLPDDPYEEMAVAFAGPAMNFLLMAVFGWMKLILPEQGMLSALNWMLISVNGLLAVSNLLPAYPMDGGRILRAFLATRMPAVEATKRAIQVGSVFAWGFVVLGVYFLHLGLFFTGLFLLWALRNERRQLVAEIWRSSTGQRPPWDADLTIKK